LPAATGSKKTTLKKAEILEKITFLARSCCLQLLAVLLAVEQLRKKAAAGRKTPWL